MAGQNPGRPPPHSVIIRGRHGSLQNKVDGWDNLVLHLHIHTYSRHNESIWAGRLGDLIPMKARFSVQPRPRPRNNTASYTVGTVSLLWVKRSGRGFDHPTPYSAECKERVELYLYFHSGTSWPATGRIFNLITGFISSMHISSVHIFLYCLVTIICYGR